MSQLVVVACWVVINGYIIDAPASHNECWRIELFESTDFQNYAACSEHLAWWMERPWMKQQIATLSMINQSAPDAVKGHCSEGESWL